MVRGLRIKLVPKTNHGKNRIHQFGDEYIVKREGWYGGERSVLVESVNEHRGPVQLNSNLNENYIGKRVSVREKNFDLRWVNLVNDKDFEMKEVI